VPDILIGSFVVGFVILVMVGLVFLAIWIRRSGSAGPAVGAAMAAYEEAMHSTAFDTFVEVQAQKDRKIPTQVPQDG
jgi:glucose dehydrogenase